MLELLDAHGTGLVISLDEVHRSNLDEFRAVTDAVAYAMSQEAPLAFVAAGLPASIDTIVNDEVSTFLRRASRINLGGFTPDETALALRLPAEESGKRFDAQALALGTEASLGYPYMVQIIGDLAWRESADAEVITADHVEAIIGEAKEILIQQIYEPTLAALTPGARRYLNAMAADDRISHTGEIAERLGAKKQTANDYRRMRLRMASSSLPPTASFASSSRTCATISSSRRVGTEPAPTEGSGRAPGRPGSEKFRPTASSSRP
ncbi:hypothetical protein IOD13_03740 [Brevibacterium casei]|nr:hypothetical protein [Brevibacterium casei]